jgi:hypothetical protein
MELAHSHLGPRTWLAGRRFRSTSTATFSPVSAAALPASSQRLAGLRVRHQRAMPSSPDMATPYRRPARAGRPGERRAEAAGSERLSPWQLTFPIAASPSSG